MHKRIYIKQIRAMVVILFLLLSSTIIYFFYTQLSGKFQSQQITENQKPNISIAVSTGNTVFFESWAQPNDILVIYGDNFNKIPELKTGKIGWNVPSFAHIKETESLWKDKVNVLIYDYETWEKTPGTEQQDTERTAKELQTYANSQGVALIMGCSFRMITLPGARQEYENNKDTTNWDALIDRKKIENIVKNVENFGVNGVGLRSEDPDSYVSFFNAIGRYAKEVTPQIKLWPVLDARTETGKQMYELVSNFSIPIEGVAIMGSDESVLSEFVDLTRN